MYSPLPLFSPKVCSGKEWGNKADQLLKEGLKGTAFWVREARHGEENTDGDSD